MKRHRALLMSGVAALLATAAASTVSFARGDDSARPRDHASANQCKLSGTAPMPADLPIYSRKRGGKPVARFTGAEITLTAHHFPTKPLERRVAVQTGSGTGGFRIVGFVDFVKLPIYTTREISVSAGGYVRLGEAQQVRCTGARPDRLRVAMRLQNPMQQTFEAWALCSSLSLEQRPQPDWAVPGEARGYVVVQNRVELFDTWRQGRSLVGLLNLATGLLTWSTEEPHGGFVHIEYHGPVVIKAWARIRDLRQLPAGEREDRLLPPVRHRAEQAKLQMAGTPGW